MSPRRRLAVDEEIDPLAFACPVCRARPGVACRDQHSRAKRRPPAVDPVSGSPVTHVARGWAQRACPTCHAPPLEPCVTPSGRSAPAIHTARRRPPASQGTP